MARITIEIPKDFTFSCILKVRITDLNYGGHLGNEQFLAYAQEARVQWLNHLGYNDEKSIDGIGLIMADAGIRFQGEGFHGQQIKVELAVTEVGRGSFDLIYRMLEVESGRAIAEIKTGMVCYDYERRRPVVIPQAFLTKMDVSGQTE